MKTKLLKRVRKEYQLFSYKRDKVLIYRFKRKDPDSLFSRYRWCDTEYSTHEAAMDNFMEIMRVKWGYYTAKWNRANTTTQITKVWYNEKA